jgi:hypothetical protein
MRWRWGLPWYHARHGLVRIDERIDKRIGWYDHDCYSIGDHGPD